MSILWQEQRNHNPATHAPPCKCRLRKKSREDYFQLILYLKTFYTKKSKEKNCKPDRSLVRWEFKTSQTGSSKN